MAGTPDDRATEFESAPDESLSDSAPESDDLSRQSSLESDGSAAL